MEQDQKRAPKPPRHKMVTLTYVGLLAPVYVIPEALASLLPEQRLLVTVLTVGLIVALMM